MRRKPWGGNNRLDTMGGYHEEETTGWKQWAGYHEVDTTRKPWGGNNRLDTTGW